MEKYFFLRFKIPEEHFQNIQEILDILKKRGWKQKGGLNIQDILFVSLLKSLTPQFRDKFIAEHTPVDFLVQEALKEPSLRKKLAQFLKTNQKNSTKTGKA